MCAVPGFFIGGQLFVDDFQRLVQFAGVLVDGEFDLPDLVFRGVSVAPVADFAQELPGARKLPFLGMEIRLGDAHAPDMFGEQDGLFGHSERSLGLVVFPLLGVHLAELEVKVGDVHLFQPVPLGDIDGLEVGVDGRIVERFGPVNVS